MLERQREGPAPQERRATERHKLELKKIFSAELAYDSVHDLCYVYVVDISLGSDDQGGIRITCDHFLPEDTAVRIRFHLDEPFEAVVQVSWGRQLEGGTYVYGLKFVDLGAEGARAVRAFMDRWSPEARRRNFRLNHVIRVECMVAGESRHLYVLALDFSTRGMKISSEEPFDEGVEMDCRLYLDQEPVTVRARVQWQRESAVGFQLGLEFTDVDETTAGRIDAYIDRVISGHLTTQRAIPEDVWEDDRE